MSRAVTEITSHSGGPSVFISYAHEDEAYRLALEEHLSFLRRRFKLEFWHDRMLQPGDPWEQRISDELEQANLILLLVSPSFANSDYCWGVETKRALERQRQGDALVVPILVRPVEGWSETPLGKLQTLPSEADPVSQWLDQDAAYLSVAKGLRTLIEATSPKPPNLEPEWHDWFLVLDGTPEEYGPPQRAQIAAELRKAANSEELELRDVLPGSAKLQLRTTEPVLETLRRLHSEGKLAEKIGRTIQGIEPDLGAVLRLEIRTVSGEVQSKIHYSPEQIGGRSMLAEVQPLVGGIEFPLANPLQIGFSLLADATYPMPTPTETVELQTRLGRYLNTFLVLDGGQVHVNLSPTEPYCGLPELLRRTELGRDMLAQDVVLKHFTALQLHPSTPQGKTFWERLNALSPGGRNFESCFRVWIVPGSASIHEKSVDGQAHVTIEKLGLEVLCEQDYETLRQYHELQGAGSGAPPAHGLQREALGLFKELILPEVQKAVSIGPNFGMVRQMLSVMVIAKWIMQTELGKALKDAGFVGSNTPEKYGLNTVGDAELESMKSLYLEMFRTGIWRQATLQFNQETGAVETRVTIAGGIELSQGSL